LLLLAFFSSSLFARFFFLFIFFHTWHLCSIYSKSPHPRFMLNTRSSSHLHHLPYYTHCTLIIHVHEHAPREKIAFRSDDLGFSFHHARFLLNPYYYYSAREERTYNTLSTNHGTWINRFTSLFHFSFSRGLLHVPMSLTLTSVFAFFVSILYHRWAIYIHE